MPQPLAGGHARRPCLASAVAGLALPTLDVQPPQDDQVAGMGAVAVPGAGPAEGQADGVLGRARWRSGAAGVGM